MKSNAFHFITGAPQGGTCSEVSVLSSQWAARTFCWSMTALSLTPRDPPRSQLRSWIGSHLLPHPPCSPDLAPRDFHLFPKMNEDLRGHLCDSNEEVESTLRSQTKKHSVELFREGFEKLVRLWGSCA